MRSVLPALVAAALWMTMSCRPQAPAPTPPAAGVVAAAPAFTPPVTRAGEEGQAKYVDPPTYDATKVADLAPGTGSPEAAVVHYMASRVRGDRRHREVMSRACSSDCAEALAEHDQWKFRAFRLVAREAESPDRVWITVWMQIEYEGEMDEGEDEFTVVEEAGQFRILEVPL